MVESGVLYACIHSPTNMLLQQLHRLRTFYNEGVMGSRKISSTPVQISQAWDFGESTLQGCSTNLGGGMPLHTRGLAGVCSNHLHDLVNVMSCPPAPPPPPPNSIAHSTEKGLADAAVFFMSCIRVVQRFAA